MQLFSKRPLCFFCLLFLTVSAMMMQIQMGGKIYLLAAVAAVAIIFLGVFLYASKDSLKNIAMYILLCLVFVFVAIANVYFRVDIPQREAEKYVGERAVSMLVVSKDHASEYSTEYTVKIKQIGDEAVDIKARLVCGFEAEANEFDKIYALAEIKYPSKSASTNSDYGALLTVVIDDGENALYRRAAGDSLWEKICNRGIEGLPIGIEILRDRIADYIVELFGKDSGAIAAGLLMNEKSEIDAEIIRDFRRSGVSHLLAVSGLHISLLLGAVELLLRKLSVAKGIRCIFLVPSAFCLLMLAGFSMSACRSVFMLFVLYINYMLMEENDSPTSLFFAVFIIVLIMPYSIKDLGLLMSFLATLGLVTVYPVFDSFVTKLFNEKLPRKLFLSLLEYLIKSIGITLIANVFLLPVMWYVFGEFSLASIPVNLLTSPVVAILLPCIAIGAAVGRIPFICTIAVKAVELLTKCLVGIISFFSDMSLATVSLRYEFVDYIMYAFLFFMCLFMVVNLKRKWILSLPGVLSAVAFCICLAVHNFVSLPSLFYYTADKNDLFISIDKEKASIVDFSGGSIDMYSDALYFARNHTATSIDSIVFSHVHYKHISCMEYVMKNNVVRKIYLPMPEDAEASDISREIYFIAKEHGTEIELYESEDILTVSDMTAVSVLREYDNGEKHIAINALLSYGDKIVLFSNNSSFSYAAGYVSDSDVLVFGAHNSVKGNEVETVQVADGVTVIFSSADNAEKSGLRVKGGEVYSVRVPTAPISLDRLLS